MRIDLTHDEEDLAIDPNLKTIGYFKGMRIVVNVYSMDVYFEVIPKSMLNYNDALFMDRLKPLSVLPKKESVEVMEWLDSIDINTKVENIKKLYNL